jgi:ABC-2 type transport system ATP-binding protein
MGSADPVTSVEANLPPGEAPAVALRRLSKSYGPVRAVRDASLEVRRGEVFGFLGLNGAGKTTTIRILLDLLRPSAGSAALFGLDCQRDSRRARALAGYLPGELGLYPDLTGAEILALLARLGAAPVSPAWRNELLERLELAPGDLHRPVRDYSAGMKRKLGIVQALQADPPLLLLDEPTEGLDPLVQRSLNDLLFELRRRGRTVFMSSHVLSEVELVCDRIAVIRDGEIALVSTVADLRRMSGRTVHVRFERDTAAVGLPPGMRLVERSPASWQIRVEGDLGPLLPLLAGLPVKDLEIVEPALEDVLRRFYREEPA